MIEFLLLRTLLTLAVMLVMTIRPVRPLVSVALSCSQFAIHRRFSPTYYYIRGIFHASFFWKGLISGLILFLPLGILSSYSAQDSWTPAFQGQILRLRILLPEDQDGLALSALCHTCLLWDRRMATASFSSFLLISYTAPFSGRQSCGVWAGRWGVRQQREDAQVPGSSLTPADRRARSSPHSNAGLAAALDPGL